MQEREDVTKLAISGDRSLIVLGNNVKYIFWQFIIASVSLY